MSVTDCSIQQIGRFTTSRKAFRVCCAGEHKRVPIRDRWHIVTCLRKNFWILLNYIYILGKKGLPSLLPATWELTKKCSQGYLYFPQMILQRFFFICDISEKLKKMNTQVPLNYRTKQYLFLSSILHFTLIIGQANYRKFIRKEV